MDSAPPRLAHLHDDVPGRSRHLHIRTIATSPAAQPSSSRNLTRSRKRPWHVFKSVARTFTFYENGASAYCTNERWAGLRILHLRGPRGGGVSRSSTQSASRALAGGQPGT